MNSYDMVVVGAGPSGAMVSYEAAQGSISVAILGKNIYPDIKHVVDAWYTGESASFFSKYLIRRQEAILIWISIFTIAPFHLPLLGTFQLSAL